MTERMKAKRLADIELEWNHSERELELIQALKAERAEVGALEATIRRGSKIQNMEIEEGGLPEVCPHNYPRADFCPVCSGEQL